MLEESYLTEKPFLSQKHVRFHFDSLVNHNKILTNYSYGEKHGLMHFSAL